MEVGDAVVIGGGLAGTAFAIELARHGRRVVVLERSKAPTQKVCGDFLSTEAIELLAYLGLDAASLGASEIDTFVLAAGKSTATLALPFRAAGLSRLLVDEALLSLAARAGAEVRRGVTAASLEPANGAAVVDAGGRRLYARFVALATGKHNLRGWARSYERSATGFKIQAQLSIGARHALAGHVRLALFDGGYVGACLVENGLATVCWQVANPKLRDVGMDWTAQLAALARASPAIRDLLADAQFLAPRPVAVSSIPFGYMRREAIANSVFAIGDQIAVIPAFTGDGTSIALASGIMAARAVLAGETATVFQRRFVAALRRQFAVARLANAALRLGSTRPYAVAALAAFPAIGGAIARLTRLKLVGVIAPRRSADLPKPDSVVTRPRSIFGPVADAPRTSPISRSVGPVG